MTAPVNLYWDSCIFIRYLSGSNADAHYGDICQYVEEAKGKDPRWKIHFSTLVYAEMRPEYLKKGGFGSIEEFFSDLGKAFYPIEPNPNILIAAGELHSAKPVDSSKKPTPFPPNPPELYRVPSHPRTGSSEFQQLRPKFILSPSRLCRPELAVVLGFVG